MACLGVSEETVITPEAGAGEISAPDGGKHRNVSVYPAGGTREQSAEFLRLLENAEKT